MTNSNYLPKVTIIADDPSLAEEYLLGDSRSLLHQGGTVLWVCGKNDSYLLSKLHTMKISYGEQLKIVLDCDLESHLDSSGNLSADQVVITNLDCSESVTNDVISALLDSGVVSYILAPCLASESLFALQDSSTTCSIQRTGHLLGLRAV